MVSVIDQITVSDQGSGRLLLKKRVGNETQPGEDDTPTNNTAGSGDFLIYTIQFENIGAGPLNTLKIMDNTPAFTQLSKPVGCPGSDSLPAGLGTCKVQTLGADNDKGYRGRIIWHFDGELSPGAKGEVSYELMVE